MPLDEEQQRDISFEDGSFVDLPTHITQITVMPLVHMTEGGWRSVGTCFVITNDGVCMTARHVVEEAYPQQTVPGWNELPANAGGLYALYVSTDPNPDNPEQCIGGFLPVWRVWMIDGIDIALIKLTVPTMNGEPLRLPLNPLRLSPPGVGESFFALGYRAMEWTETNPNALTLEARYSATRGEVEELHLGGRDRVVLPFPCFRTSARFDSGMSGGPVYDHSGRVFGVVCSSFEAEDAPFISYASLLAPALVINIDVADEPGSPSRPAFLWDLLSRTGSLYLNGALVEATPETIKITLGQSLTFDSTLGS